MEVLEMSGELVRVDDVLHDWESILMDCKGKLLSIPSKLATLVTDIENPAEAQDLIEDHIREALEELANYAAIRERQGNTTEGDGRTAASSEVDNL